MSYFFRREQLIKAAKGKGNPWKNAGGKFSSEDEDEDSQPYHYTGKQGDKAPSRNWDARLVRESVLRELDALGFDPSTFEGKGFGDMPPAYVAAKERLRENNREDAFYFSNTIDNAMEEYRERQELEALLTEYGVPKSKAAVLSGDTSDADFNAKLKTYIHEESDGSKNDLRYASRRSIKSLAAAGIDYKKIPKIDPKHVAVVKRNGKVVLMFYGHKVPQFFRVKTTRGQYLIDTQGFNYSRYAIQLTG